MKLHRHFLALHAVYGERGRVSVTLEEVAAALACTHRSALTLVHKMAELGWIEWTSSRGRGQRSVLRFAVPSEQIAAEAVLGAIRHGDLQRALTQFGDRSQPPAVRQRLRSWLHAYFGRHSEERSDRRVDTLRLPIRQRLQTLDPLRMQLLAEAFVSSHVFDSLVTRRGPDFAIEPHLAHDWDTDRNGVRWTFHLRKGVRLHDGRELDAADVVRSFERLTASPHPVLYSSILRSLGSVRAVGRGAVEFRLKECNALFLPFLATSRAAVAVSAPSARTGADTDAERGSDDGLVGTGPFLTREFADGGCVLEAFPAYFRGRAQLDRAEIVHVPWAVGEQSPDDASPFHIVPGPSAAAEPHWRTLPSTASIRKFITCNSDKPGPLAEPAIRAHIGACLGGGPLGAASTASDRNAAIAPPGRNKTLALKIATIPPYERDADAAAAVLNASGYACSVLLLQPAQFAGELRLQADLILFSLYMDRDLELRQFDLYTTAAAHFSAPLRREIERLLRAAAGQSDTAARKHLFERIEARLTEERQLFILSERPVRTVCLPEVRGVSFNSQGWVDLRKLWFPDASPDRTPASGD